MGVREDVRPPLGVWLRYRFFGSRVPAEYLPWVEHDIESGSYARMRWVVFVALYVPAFLVASLLTGDLDGWGLFAPVIGLAVGVSLRGRSAAVRRVDAVWARKVLAYQRGEITREELTGSSRFGIFVWAVGGLAVGLFVVLLFALFS